MSVASSSSALQTLESRFGVRFSLLLELPFFDPIVFPVIDPMHNLLLGTAKHILNLWIKRDILTAREFQVIQERSEQILIPRDVGRIPLKIGSGFSGFTADQWRIWTTVLSPVVLKGVLPNTDLRCWLLYVRACTLLCSRIISTSDVKIADQYLGLFCKKFQELYGDDACTPNMHLHMHLVNCLLDYGPVHSFWCFPFERFNGVLGAYHTNKKSIEVQFMTKFLREQAVGALSWPDNTTEFQALLKEEVKGSVGETGNVDVISMMELATVHNLQTISYKKPNRDVLKLIPPLKEKVLSSDDSKKLRSVYEQLYPSRTISLMSRFISQCRRIMFANELIGSGNLKEAVIMAYWPGGGSSLSSIEYGRCRVGVIQYFLRHCITFSDQTTEEHVFCYVLWKQDHPSRDWFGKSATVTSMTYKVEDACCYMPVQRIAHHCASGEMSVDFDSVTEKVFVVCPIALRFCIH